MAINRGVLGTQTGSMGNITASTWKGRNVFKQKVPANNLSNTPAQSTQRRKFAALAKLAGILGAVVRVGYRALATSVTEFNLFQSNNKLAVTDNGAAAVVDYSMIKVSGGTVEALLDLDATYTQATGAMVVGWNPSANGGTSLAGDKIYVAAYDEASGLLRTAQGTVARSAGTVTLNFAAGTVLASAQVYAFAKRAGSTAASPSRHTVA